MLTPELKALAQDARPIDDADYGSERQVNAENKFFEECQKLAPAMFEEGSNFSNYALKATPEESIDEAVRILSTLPARAKKRAKP